MSAMAAKGSKSTESDAFIPLPDPYGEGFEYSEDPIENTRNQWSVLENRRLKAGRVARHPILMLWRTMSGFSLAVFAFASLLYAPVIESLNGLIFILIPLMLMAVAPTVVAGESAWQAMQARISLREQVAFVRAKSTLYGLNLVWTVFWKVSTTNAEITWYWPFFRR